MKARNLNDLIKKLKGDNDAMTKFNQNPIEFLEDEVNMEHPMMNKFVFLIIVIIVTAVLGVCIWAAFKIEFFEEPGKYAVPEYIIGIIGTCLGAVVGLLAPSPVNQG